jgi:antitoxin Phd
MRRWPVQDAKAKFSELLDRCLSEGPQVVTRRGAEAAVFVPIEQWTRMTEAARPTLKELLLGPGPRFDLELPPRGRLRRRPVKPLD